MVESSRVQVGGLDGGEVAWDDASSETGKNVEVTTRFGWKYGL